MRKIITIVAVSVLVMTLTVSCRKEGTDKIYVGSDIISVLVTDNALPSVTKGAPVTSDNMVTEYGRIVIDAAYRDGEIYTGRYNPRQLKDVAVEYSPSEGEWIFKEIIDGVEKQRLFYWPEDDASTLTFCSYAPESSVKGLQPTVSLLGWNNGTKLEFTYVQPAPAEASPYEDASNQKDLLFALNTQNRVKDVVDGKHYADINFSHALTGVKFVKGELQDCIVKYIVLSNFKSEGNASAVPDGKNGLTFTWSGQDVLETYRQDFGTDMRDLEKGESLDPTENEEYTFMMIPQALDESATITVGVEYTEGDTEEIIFEIGKVTDDKVGTGNAAKLKDWSSYAGKVITLKVNYDDDILNVEITSFEERVDNTIKDKIIL